MKPHSKSRPSLNENAFRKRVKSQTICKSITKCSPKKNGKIAR
jgi:hypothetical protein